MSSFEPSVSEPTDDNGGVMVGTPSRWGKGYTTLENHACSSHMPESSSPLTASSSSGEQQLWYIQVLTIFSLALIADVVILMLYIFSHQPKSVENVNAITWLPVPPSDQALSKIAFGSCSSQYMPQPYWDTLVHTDPDIVVLMGDNVYGDCDDEACTALQAAYKNWTRHASFVGATKLLPIIATLDDHDYGQGDTWSENPHKHLAKQFFLDFFDIQDERRQRDGVYKEYMFGPPGQRVQILLLDTRFDRSLFVGTGIQGAPYTPYTNNSDSDKRMLSESQWAWLKESLTQEANVRLIVSSIQVLNAGTGFECWRHIPKEQRRLIKLLEPVSQTSLVVLLSGDRHMGGFYEFENLKEITASSWTHTVPFGAYDDCNSVETCDEWDTRRVGNLVRVNHFGMCDIDWRNRSMTVSLVQTDTTPNYMYFVERDHLKGSDAGQLLQSHSYSIP